MTATKSLAEALAAVQAEAPTFKKSKTARVPTKNGGEYTYHYADLGDILPVVGPLLAKHGLSWSSKPGRTEDGELVLRYRLLHVSGESDGDAMPLGVDKHCKPQELGSAITYARRYALTAQLNLATEEDDDGQTAQGASRSRSAGNGQPQASATANGSERAANAAQRRLINVRAAEAGLSASLLANIVRLAMGEEPREFPDDKAGQDWLNRYMDRLAASKVDTVLENIKGAAVTS